MKLALLSLLLLVFCAATLAATSGNGSNNGSAATTTPASAQRPPNQVNPAAFNSNDNNNNSASSAMAAPQQQQSVQFQSGDNCPPLLGNNFPSRQTLTAQGGQSQSCQWIIISNQQNCPQFFQNCGSNQQMCRSQNEIWWQCTSDCEPSCGNPSPSCRRRCGRSGCQCFPGFLRNQGGFCVPSSQCPSADCSDDNDCPGQSVCVNSQCQQPDCSNDNDCPGNQICENNQCQESGCSNDNDCPGSSSICVNRQCRQGCTSDNACAIDAQCSNGRCVERRQCQQDRQCRGQKICFNRQCRLVGSISCRSNFDCPRSAFCGRNGRCFFPNTRAIEDGFDF